MLDVAFGENFQLEGDPKKSSDPDGDQGEVEEQGEENICGEDIGKGQAGPSQNKGASPDRHPALSVIKMFPAGLDDFPEIVEGNGGGFRGWR
jgi:hypothetical protein